MRILSAETMETIKLYRRPTRLVRTGATRSRLVVRAAHQDEPPARPRRIPDDLRAHLDEHRASARRHLERVSGLVKRTFEELDQMAREDVEEIRAAVEARGGCDAKRGGGPPPPPPGEVPPEPEFFRDPQRANQAVRADSDPPSHLS